MSTRENIRLIARAPLKRDDSSVTESDQEKSGCVE